MDGAGSVWVCNPDDSEWAATYRGVNLPGAADAGGVFIASAVDLLNLLDKQGLESQGSREPHLTLCSLDGGYENITRLTSKSNDEQTASTVQSYATIIEEERKIMPDENGKAKLRGTTPVFLVGDIVSTMQWYQAHLGFNAELHPPAPPHSFCILQKDDAVIFLQQLDGYQKPDHYHERAGGVWNVYLRTEGVRELFQALSELGTVPIIEPLCPQPYGQIEFVIRDLNWYILVFAEPL
jgi:Glyoxalase/Bleomycin resistance protein/Dioxygenase superfamily